MRKKPRSSSRVGACEHVLARHVAASQVVADGLAQRGQRPREAHHLVELLLVATHAPARVVEVLLAPALVQPRRLDVAAGVGTDPDVPPGGWDHELGNALQDHLVGDALARLVDV